MEGDKIALSAKLRWYYCKHAEGSVADLQRACRRPVATDSSRGVVLVTGLRVQSLGVRFLAGQDFPLFITTSRAALWPLSGPLRCSSLGLRRPGWEANSSHALVSAMTMPHCTSTGCGAYFSTRVSFTFFLALRTGSYFMKNEMFPFLFVLVLGTELGLLCVCLPYFTCIISAYWHRIFR